MLNYQRITVPQPDPHEIVSVRRYAAPRARVYGAFADPAVLGRWWGPKGFTNTIREFDLRPGGAWRFSMHAPDGTTYENAKDFLEVQEPERIVFKNLDKHHSYTMTMTFAETSGGSTETELTWRMHFDSAEHASDVRAVITSANEENFDRLAAHLTAAFGAVGA